MAFTWLDFRCATCASAVSLPLVWAPYKHSPALRCYDCRGRLRLVLPRKGSIRGRLIPRPRRRRYRRVSWQREG
jgi:hypothetical protein